MKRRRSIPRSWLAFLLISTACMMLATDRIVPNELWTIIGMILAYYFGTKTQEKNGGYSNEN